MSNQKNSIRLRSYKSSPGTAYIELIDHPMEIQSGMVNRSISIDHLIPNYDGPKLTIDFNSNGIAIGIEIIYPYDYLGNDDSPDGDLDDEA